MIYHKILTLSCLLVISSCAAQKDVTFEVTGIPSDAVPYIGIRGSIAPLSWDKTIFLNNDEGKHSISLNFQGDIESLEYKFVIDNGKDIVWEGISNRSEEIAPGTQSFISKWNTEKFIDPKTLPKLSVDQLMEDYEAISNVILQVHPGLYRYNDSLTVRRNLDILKSSFQRPLSYAEAFLNMSKMIATIQCDHTMVSAYNQESLITSLIHRQKDKVPFAFKWINNKMIITHNGSPSKVIKKGVQVISIDGIPASEILETMLPYISSDGATIHNKISKAEVSGYAFRYNAFDILHPLLYPIVGEQIRLVIKSPDEPNTITETLSTTTREERSQAIENKYDGFPRSPEDLWDYKIIDGNIGYLKIGSFATNDFNSDWKQMLKDAFQDMKKNKIENLILDIRENQGGLDDASYELEKYIYQNDFITDGLQSQSRFLTFPEEVKPHIQTWDYWFYDLKDDEHFQNGIYHVFPNDITKRQIKPSKNTFRGNIYMLTSAQNVSGAFYLARLFKKSKSGVLVGQETGGNQNGINGGAILFFKPPNSRINVNIPVLGNFSTEVMPDRGIIPDYVIDRSIKDLINGEDSSLNKTIDLIRRK